MSNFKCRVKIKSTGKIVEANAIDDFFDIGEYGYKVKNGQERSKVYKASDVEVL